MSIIVKGVIFAAPTAPGYAPGKRVVVTATIDPSGGQVTTIDGAKGSEIAVASVPVTQVKYITTGESSGHTVNPGALTATVTFGVVQGEQKAIGNRTVRLTLTDQSGQGYHTGSVLLEAFATIGSDWSDAGETPDTAPVDDPGYGLYCQFWETRDFAGGIFDTGTHAINFASAEFGWPGADPAPSGLILADGRRSIRAVGYARIPTAGMWRFRVVSKAGSGIGAWVDAARFADRRRAGDTWTAEQVDDSPYREYAAEQMVAVRVDYSHNYRPHAVRLEWQKEGAAPVVIPAASLYEAPEVGTTAVVLPPDQSQWYIESVNRYQEG